jgi:ADP-ribosylglycohydrolase
MNTNFSIEKCNSIFLLHALGDTIGFKNSIWEFNYNVSVNDVRSTIEIISEFISLGGITNINLEDWHISDDTLFNYEIAKFILDLNNDDINEKHIIKLKKEINKMIDNQIKLKIERGFGLMTINAIENWSDTKDERHTLYNIYSGGNGCAMRTLPIGIRFHKDKDLNKLIECSIITSKITHNSPIGFLGGLATAYFVKLAINNIPLNEWPYLLIELYDSNEVKKYINKNDDNIFFDYRNCIKIWKKVIEMFFSEDKKPLKLKSSINLISRFKIFLDIDKTMTDNEYGWAGGNGQTAVIMAYIALLDCEGNWEKLVYYAMLHGGDSDTVGAIAGGLFGAFYGMNNVSEHLLKHIEMKKEILEISEKIYKLST